MGGPCGYSFSPLTGGRTLRNMLTFAELKRKIKRAGKPTSYGSSIPWAACTPDQRVEFIYQTADKLRGDELISTRTRVAAENWASRELWTDA